MPTIKVTGDLAHLIQAAGAEYRAVLSDINAYRISLTTWSLSSGSHGYEDSVDAAPVSHGFIFTFLLLPLLIEPTAACKLPVSLTKRANPSQTLAIQLV